MLRSEFCRLGRAHSVIRVADQALNSLSNAVFVVALAELTSIETFARVAVAYVFGFSIVGLNRMVLGDGVQLGEVNPAQARKLARAAVPAEVSLVSVVALVTGLSLFESVAIGAAFAPVFVGDVARVAALVRDGARRAVTGDALWLGAQGAGFVLARSLPSAAQLPVLLAAWGLGSTLLILVCRGGASQDAAAGLGLVHLARRRTAGAGDFLIVTGGSTVALVLLASRSPDAAAQVRAAATVFAPMDALIAGLRLTYLPRLRDVNAKAAAGYVLGASSVACLIFIAASVLAEWPVAESIDIIGLARPALAWTFLLVVVRAVCRPVIDLGVVEGLVRPLALGRALGELAALAALVLFVETSSGFVGVRLWSPVAAALLVAGSRRASAPTSLRA